MPSVFVRGGQEILQVGLIEDSFLWRSDFLPRDRRFSGSAGEEVKEPVALFVTLKGGKEKYFGKKTRTRSSKWKQKRGNVEKCYKNCAGLVLLVLSPPSPSSLPLHLSEGKTPVFVIFPASEVAAEIYIGLKNSWPLNGPNESQFEQTNRI